MHKKTVKLIFINDSILDAHLVYKNCMEAIDCSLLVAVYL